MSRLETREGLDAFLFSAGGGGWWSRRSLEEPRSRLGKIRPAE